MKTQNRSCGRNITGKTLEDVSSNVTAEIRRIWDRINEIAIKMNQPMEGDPGISDSKTDIRLVQLKENGVNTYYIEAKYPDGWCRLSTGLTKVTKGGN